MPSLNKMMLIGRLGQDPQIVYMQSGTPVANLSIATDESYTDKDGNKVERTEWHRVVVFNRQAEFCGNYLTKGRLVFVEGKLRTRKWQDQQGQDRYTTEVVASRIQALDPKREQAGDSGSGSGGMGDEYGPAYTGDDAPF
jgi:single-strand DNA-binding protein